MAIASLYLAPFVYMVPPNQKISKFVWGNSQSPAPTMPNPLKKNRPPDRIYSFACSLRCTKLHVPIWSVPGTVCLYGSPKPKNLEICVGEFTKSCTNLVRSHQEVPATG